MSSIEDFLKQSLSQKDIPVGEEFMENIPRFIDYLTQLKHGFSVSGSMGANFRGANILANSTMLKPNTNSPGYIFTTRPDLNLSSANLKAERKMMPLLTENEKSIMRAIRLILSPRLGMSGRMKHEMGGRLTGESNLRRGMYSPLINPHYPFIAVSDNLVKSATGWPSNGLGIHNQAPGVLKESHIMVDGPSTYNNDYSLNLSLNSMKGSPTLYLYYYWILYIGFVYSQTYGLMPWPEYLGNGRLDYTCRIYRLIMDETRTFVEETCCTGYAIPRSIDIGPVFDYQAENPRPYIDRTVDVEFACSGVIYLDEIIIKQFNETVWLFEPLMEEKNRRMFHVKVDKKYQRIFNNECLPFINPITRELEWWVRKEHVLANKDLIAFSNLTINGI